LRRLRHEVVLLQLVSPQERDPQLPAEVVLVDAEDGTTHQVEVTPGLMAAYRQTFERHVGDTQAYCRKYGWGFARVDTDTPFEQTVLRGLREQRLLR
jgi:hypothetical protein